MIFVTLGTQDKEFKRLVKKVDDLVKEGKINDDVVVQIGSTNYHSKNLKILKMLSIEDFNNYIEKSRFVISHGGVGSIIDTLKKGKKVIAVPRLSKYEEMANDHQVQIVSEFAKLGYIIGCKDETELEDAIKNIDKFKPKKYQSNNDNFIKFIDEFIQKSI